MDDTSKTKGRVIGLKSWYMSAKRDEIYSPPMVRFATDSLLITFQGETNLDYEEGEIVPVIYKTTDPANAHINTFLGLWLAPLLYCLLPLMVLTAVLFSFMNERDILVIDFGRFLFWKKKYQKQDRNSFINFTQIDKTPVLKIGEEKSGTEL